MIHEAYQMCCSLAQRMPRVLVSRHTNACPSSKSTSAHRCDLSVCVLVTWHSWRMAAAAQFALCGQISRPTVVCFLIIQRMRHRGQSATSAPSAICERMPPISLGILLPLTNFMLAVERSLPH